MFEHFHTPSEVYNYKLGAALKMEQEALQILDDSSGNARSDLVATLLSERRRETEQHVEVLEQVFGAFEWEVDDSPCPAIEGLKAEGRSMMKKTDRSLVDSIILQGRVEVEHHAIGVYTNLVLNARAMGRNDVVDLLERNLHSEEQALANVIALQEQMAAVIQQSGMLS